MKKPSAKIPGLRIPLACLAGLLLLGGVPDGVLPAAGAAASGAGASPGGKSTPPTGEARSSNGPAADDERPAADKDRPAADDERPATDKDRPAADDERGSDGEARRPSEPPARETGTGPGKSPPVKKRPAKRPQDRAAKASGPEGRPAPEERPRREVIPRTSTPAGGELPEERKMRQLQGAAWAMVGVTAVLLTVSGVFALMVEDREDEIERMATMLDPTSEPSYRPLIYEGVTRRDFEQYHKEGRRYEIAAFTFLGLTAASAVAAATLFIVDHVTKPKAGDDKRALRLRPVIGPQGAGIALGVEF